VTLQWFLFRTPVKWVDTLDAANENDLNRCGNWWSRKQEQTGTFSDESMPVAAIPDTNQFPTLVRLLELHEAGPDALIGLPDHPYQVLAKLVPNVCDQVLWSDTEEEWADRLEPVQVDLEEFRTAAEELGLLMHPVHGDSAFSWTATSLTFQLLLTLWSLLDSGLDEGDPQGYGVNLERLQRYWWRAKAFQLEGHTYGLDVVPRPHIFRAPEVKDFFRVNDQAKRNNESHINAMRAYSKAKQKLPLRRALRQKVIEWLQEELNKIFYNQECAKLSLQFDQHESTRTVFKSLGKPLGKGEAFTYFGVQTGLYACALFAFLTDFRKGGTLKACEGCGRLFLPPRKDARYCPSTSARCRKRAQREREKR